MSSKHLIGVEYSALDMSDDTSLSVKSSSNNSKGVRIVNFHAETFETSAVAAAARRGSKFFQRPRSMSAISDISRSSMRLDER